MRTDEAFEVSDKQRERLEVIATDGNSNWKHARRWARIILLTDDGLETKAIATEVGVTKATVWRWQRRLKKEGVERLLRDMTQESELIELALNPPPDEERYWTVPALAKKVGIEVSTARRIRTEHKLAPHRWRHLKVSIDDPYFTKKAYDVAGLYMYPSYRAVVLSINKKTHIQASERTWKSLSMKPGRPATTAYDYEQNKISTLLVVLNTLYKTVINRHAERHQHQEFIAFLDQVDREVPDGHQIHAILGSYTAHKPLTVMNWLAKHRRWTFHSTPTSCSWINTAEGLFRKLGRRWLRRGAHKSIEGLEMSIQDFLAWHNENEAKPFKWTADSERIGWPPAKEDIK